MREPHINLSTDKKLATGRRHRLLTSGFALVVCALTLTGKGFGQKCVDDPTVIYSVKLENNEGAGGHQTRHIKGWPRPSQSQANATMFWDQNSYYLFWIAYTEGATLVCKKNPKPGSTVQEKMMLQANYTACRCQNAGNNNQCTLGYPTQTKEITFQFQFQTGKGWFLLSAYPGFSPNTGILTCQ